jgi:hypothetical protein
VAGDHLVTLVQTAAQPTAVVAEQTSWERFPALWRELLEEVWSFVRGANAPAGRNVMLYRDDVPNVEVGVEVDGPFVPAGRIISSSLPAGRAARTVARGAPSPEGIAAAHAAVVAWCDEHRHARSSTRWEVYGHWREDQDPAQYEIEVYWLLSLNPAAAGIRSGSGRAATDGSPARGARWIQAQLTGRQNGLTLAS